MGKIRHWATDVDVAACRATLRRGSGQAPIGTETRRTAALLVVVVDIAAEAAEVENVAEEETDERGMFLFFAVMLGFYYSR